MDKERLEKRDKLYSEVKHLENAEKKITAALRVKREALREICPCNERIDCFEMTECKHCGKMH